MLLGHCSLKDMHPTLSSLEGLHRTASKHGRKVMVQSIGFWECRPSQLPGDDDETVVEPFVRRSWWIEGVASNNHWTTTKLNRPRIEGTPATSRPSIWDRGADGGTGVQSSMTSVGI